MNDLLTPPSVNAAYSVAQTIDQTAKDGVQSFVSSIKEAFKLFWKHPTVTPTEQAAQWGTNCCALFDRHAAAVAFLLSQGVELDPSDYTPPLPFVRNEDGTVTIGE